ncbi:minor capsid protein [Desulfotomaculum sp. 1211_IL3151]|uniref:minor capsid protein n=1 Tax=Desulfotomaculum sp. 1211_IL3151 TaxID=3084055 RepID=UPI002FD9F77F
MKSAEYWQKRAEQVASRQYHKADRYVADLGREYEKAILSIQRDIEVFYQRFADENGIVDMAEARKLLTSGQLKEFRMTLEEFITKAKGNANGKWTSQLNNVYYRTRISRLEALQTQIRQQVEMLSAGHKENTRAVLSDVYEDTYYRTIYEAHKGIGLGVSFAYVHPEAIAGILSQSWMGANYSQRIWNDREKLIREIETNLAQAFIRGDSIDRTAQVLAKRMDVSYSNAVRLVQTETSHIAGEATAAGYKESGVVQKYQFLATMDNRTSAICQSMDGKVFELREKQEGVNYPPLHVRCRSTTVPYFEDNSGERIARDPATRKTYTVPGDMTYKEWYNEYVQKTKPPKTKAVADSYLPKQLGFRDDNGLQKFIPSNTQVTNVHTIAGEGVSVAHRAAKRLSEQYGGNEKGWSKKAGKVESDKYLFDIHWVEHPDIGQRNYKIASKKVKK